jgi:hypothetical protein
VSGYIDAEMREVNVSVAGSDLSSKDRVTFELVLLTRVRGVILVSSNLRTALRCLVAFAESPRIRQGMRTDRVPRAQRRANDGGT